MNFNTRIERLLTRAERALTGAPAPVVVNLEDYADLSDAALISIILSSGVSAEDACELVEEAKTILLRLYPHQPGLSAFLADLPDPEGIGLC